MVAVQGKHMADQEDKVTPNRKAGGQPGNRNGTKGKLFADALTRVLERFERPKKGKVSQIERGKALEALAEKLVKRALSNGFGDLIALQEIANRLDGKPAQMLHAEIDSQVTVVFEDEIANRPADYTRHFAVDGENDTGPRH